MTTFKRFSITGRMRTITRADFIIGYFKQRRDELSVAFFVFMLIKIAFENNFQKSVDF